MALTDLSTLRYSGADLTDRVNTLLAEARAAPARFSGLEAADAALDVRADALELKTVGVKRFTQTVAALLADAVMTYSAGVNQVVTDDHITTADGHTYKVAASGATDHHITTVGGVKLYAVPDAAGHIVAEAFGTTTAQLKAAIAAAAALGRPCYIGGPWSITYTAFADCIELADGAHIVFGPKGVITMNTFGVPVFFHRTDIDGQVTLENVKISYAGTATTARPAIMDAFFTATFGTVGYSNRDQAAMMFFRGTNLVLKGTYSVSAQNFTDPTRLVPRALTVTMGPNGAFANVRADNFRFDGTLWGILAFGFDNFVGRNITSRRWSQLDTTAYPWEAPGHVFYVPVGFGGQQRVAIGDCYDSGEEVGTPYLTGSNSYKFIGPMGSITTGYLYSARASGLLDLDAVRGRIGGGFWDGSTSSAAEIAGNKAMRLATFNAGALPSDIDLGDLTFVLPADYANSLTMDARRVRGRITLRSTGVAIASAGLIVGAGMQDCDLDLILLMEQTQTASTPIVVTLNGASVRNRFRVRTTSPQWESLRFVSADKTAATGNSVELEDMTTGSRRLQARGYKRTELLKTFQSLAVSGAAITHTAAIPDGATVLGVQTYVRTALGTSLGTTGYTVGISGTPALYGTRVGTAVGVGTNDADWSAATGGGYQVGGKDLIITATGGNFDGTGAIETMLQYSIGVREGDLT